jgi:hypothetical protein
MVIDMRRNKKYLVAGIICLLMLVSLPTIVGDEEENKLNTAYPPNSEFIRVGFGRIYNLKLCYDCDWMGYCFNCENVKCMTKDLHLHHYTNGEVMSIPGDPLIVTNKFMFQPLPFKFFWVVES